MLMFVAVAALAVAANAQVLRISPAVIGSASAGSEQVINLAAGGSVGKLVAGPVGLARSPVLAKVIAAAPVPYVLSKPSLVVEKPLNLAAILKPSHGVSLGSGAVQLEKQVPAPFAFAFDSEDEFGTKLGRQETANEQGVVSGQYSLADASGILRVVKYVADEQGFHADIETNEPGTLTSNPADVAIKSSAQ